MYWLQIANLSFFQVNVYPISILPGSSRYFTQLYNNLRLPIQAAIERPHSFFIYGLQPDSRGSLKIISLIPLSPRSVFFVTKYLTLGESILESQVGKADVQNLSYESMQIACSMMNQDNNFMDQLRRSAIQETERVANKPRFGLFSQPPPVSLGDDSAFKKRMRKHLTRSEKLSREAGNKPTKSQVFTNYTPATLQKGDQYMDSIQAERVLSKSIKNHSRSVHHQAKFKPPSLFKVLAKSTYQYLPQQPPALNPKRFRTNEGKVKTEPRNFVTNPHERVVDQAFKHLKHMEQPFDRQKELNKKALLESKLKMKEAFKSSSVTRGTFTTDRATYNDQKIKQASAGRGIATGKSTWYKHDRDFKASGPCKPLIGKFPEHVPERPYQIRRKKAEADPNKRQSFRTMSCQKSKPCPSISLNKVNIAKEFKL